MDASTYEKLCEHETLYESYTYSKQPKTPKPTNIEKNKMLRNQPLLNDQTCLSRKNKYCNLRPKH